MNESNSPSQERDGPTDASQSNTAETDEDPQIAAAFEEADTALDRAAEAHDDYREAITDAVVALDEVARLEGREVPDEPSSDDEFAGIDTEELDAAAAPEYTDGTGHLELYHAGQVVVRAARTLKRSRQFPHERAMGLVETTVRASIHLCHEDVPDDELADVATTSTIVVTASTAPNPGKLSLVTPGSVAETVVDGTVYVGSGDGTVHAIDTGGDAHSEGSRVLDGALGHHHEWAGTAGPVGLSVSPDEATVQTGGERVIEIDVRNESDTPVTDVAVDVASGSGPPLVEATGDESAPGLTASPLRVVSVDQVSDQIGPEATETVTVTVQTPDEPTGERLPITVTGRRDGERVERESVLTVRVEPPYRLSLDDESLPAGIEQRRTLVLEPNVDGDLEDVSVTVSADGPITASGGENVDPSIRGLQSGGPAVALADLTLEAAVGAEGRYRLTVSMETADTSVEATIRLFVERPVDVAVDVPADGVGLEPGVDATQLTFQVTVNAPESVADVELVPEVSSLPGAWPVGPPTDGPTIDARELDGTVSQPDGSDDGIYPDGGEWDQSGPDPVWRGAVEDASPALRVGVPSEIESDTYTFETAVYASLDGGEQTRVATTAARLNVLETVLARLDATGPGETLVGDERASVSTSLVVSGLAVEGVQMQLSLPDGFSAPEDQAGEAGGSFSASDGTITWEADGRQEPGTVLTPAFDLVTPSGGDADGSYDVEITAEAIVVDDRDTGRIVSRRTTATLVIGPFESLAAKTESLATRLNQLAVSNEFGVESHTSVAVNEVRDAAGGDEFTAQDAFEAADRLSTRCSKTSTLRTLDRQ